MSAKKFDVILPNERQKDDQPFVISTFYKFFNVEDKVSLQKKTKEFLMERSIFGTILIANEGINATMAGSRDSIDEMYDFVYDIAGEILFKESYSSNPPFQRLKVRVKKEIVALGVEVKSETGYRVSPTEWDELISSDDVVILDTRNDYEYSVGTFKGAINPNTKSFRELPDWTLENIKDKEKKIVTFCTGGIRAEKFTSYMKDQGYKNVYQLDGGILGYFAKTGNKNNLWKGDCFVFDERLIVNDKLEDAC